MKELDEVRLNMNDALSGSYDMNRNCLDDYEFATVTGAMWKGSYAEQFKNKPKPEINKLFGSINRILGQKQRLEMNAKIISNSDEATDEDADLLQSRWRNDFQASDGNEALNNSDQEAFFSGFGAFKLAAKYEDEESPDQDKQYLCVEPIYSAASSVIFGPSLRKDKSDCKQAWEIIRTSRKLVEEEFGEIVSSVNAQIDWFDWNTDTEKDLYLAHYYEVIEKNITDYIFGDYIVTTGDGIKDNYGNKVTRDELKELREFNEYETKRRKVKYVEYGLMSGDKWLIKGQKTPFKRVPIIPQYGYYQVINGIEYYCGEVRKRRDPQMFLNTYHSSLMEIMAAPQVEKPEYTPEQIAKHATERSKADIDNAAFIMSDPILNPDGTVAHIGPIGKQTPPQIGTGLAAAGQQLESTLFDMSGTGQSTVPSNAASDAIAQVNERQDDAFQPLMQNSMFAIKTACDVWIDAAQKIYFTNQRTLRVMAKDGTYSQVKTLEYGQDNKGNYGPFKNSARGKFTSQVKAGESHKSMKEAELETTLKMLQFADTNSPQGQMLLNQAIISTTGEGGQRAREVAKYQIIDTMLMMGLDPKPESDEEKQYVQQKIQMMQQQQEQQQDPAMIMAQAESQARIMEGQAAMQNEVNDANENAIKQYDAQTKRIDVMTKAQKAGVDIQKTEADTQGQYIENAQKMTQTTLGNY